jgi:hypothetical protein
MTPPAGDYVFVSSDPNISGSFTSTGSALSAWSFTSNLFSRVFLSEPYPYTSMSWSNATDVAQPGNVNDTERFITANAPNAEGRSYYAQLEWSPDTSTLNAVFRVDEIFGDAVYSPPPTVSFVLDQSGNRISQTYPTEMARVRTKKLIDIKIRPKKKPKKKKS